MREYLYAAVLILCSGAGSPALAGSINKDLVPDSETAIKVASVLLETYLGEYRFAEVTKDAPLAAQLIDEKWYVGPHRKDTADKQHDPPGAVIVTAGGGGIVIVLAKKDAQVTDIYYVR